MGGAGKSRDLLARGCIEKMNGVVFFLLLATSLAYLSRADVAKLTLLPHAVDMVSTRCLSSLAWPDSVESLATRDYYLSCD